MILVNNPGSWKHVYPPLRHAEWHGWTPTDLVFPFFVFIVGVSIALALSWRVEAGAMKAALYAKILKRSLIIFSLGILLHLVPRFNLSTLRIPGVLQRIAVCYLFAALLYVNLGTRGRAGVVLLALSFYWLIMKLVPVPGYGAGVLDYQGNLCGYIDSKLLAGHLYKPEFDPEGILSTLPAVGTALLGTLAGDWLRAKRKGVARVTGLLGSGLALSLLGLALHPCFPINKQLWTPTYVLFTAGLALLVLAVFYLLIEVWRIKQWATPFIIFGTNAITAYAGSALLVKLLLEVKVSSGGETVGLLSFIYQHVFVPLAGNLNGSLLYAVTYVLLWLALMTPLYLRKIYIKI